MGAAFQIRPGKAKDLPQNRTPFGYFIPLPVCVRINFMKKLGLVLFFIIFANLIMLCPVRAEQGPDYNVYEGTNKNTQLSDNFSNNTGNILFIVDFSNSMNENLNGMSKLKMALDTLYEILPKIPPNTKVGLRVYGHTSGFTYWQGCLSSRLLVPLSTGNRSSIYGALSKTNAVGWTPITYSLKQAVLNDFTGISGKKHIILLTDGGENCDESPCTYAIELMKYRDDISIDVIAFDLYDYEAKAQLRCTALTTSGKFFNATNAGELRESLFESLNIDKEVKGQIKIKPNP